MSEFDTLERAFEGARYSLDKDTPLRLRDQLISRRYPVSRRSIPVTYADIPSSDDETDSLPSASSKRQRTARQIITPPQLSRGDSGLPPTPPTMTNSGIIERSREKNGSPTPQFADAVRNALQSRKSGLSTPGIHLPTPEPSPPATTEEFASHMSLQPPHLVRNASSLHAESFHTARENASSSQLLLIPRTPSPEPRRSPQPETPDQARELYLHGNPLTVASGSSTAPSRLRVYASSESDSSDSDDNGRDTTPRRSKVAQTSVARYPALQVDDLLEKHISYGEGDFDTFDPYVDPATSMHKPVPEHSSASPVEPEDVNNFVYRQIQEENVKRHSAISDGTVLPVGITLAGSEPREKKLKRTFKREALRADASDATESRRYSADMPLPLRYKKAISSEASAGASPHTTWSATAKTRQRPAAFEQHTAESRRQDSASNSSPRSDSADDLHFPIAPHHKLRRSQNSDRLERNSSIRTDGNKRTRSPSAGVDGRRIASEGSPQTDAKRTLRHFSRGSKLENNTSVRRTSLHSLPDASPKVHHLTQASTRSPPILREISHDSVSDANEMHFGPLLPVPQRRPEDGIPSRKLRHFTANARLENGTLAKHSPDPDRDRANIEPASYQSQQQATETTPARKLRHFTADAKLENNTSVRRTSLEQSSSPQHLNAFSGTLTPLSPQYLNVFSGTLAPSSPRKGLGLDPRFLHPSTTPFSTSQMSDRTDIEVCEARGVNIYPHNNESLLVVQHSFMPSSKDKAIPPPQNFLRMTDSQIGFGQPLFSAFVEQPSPRLSASSPTDPADSPLTNPRAAPEPPAFKVIPPTPVQELDRQLSNSEVGASGASQGRQSLLHRARRYSESFVQPFFGRSLSVRTARRAVDDNEQRPTNLSPLWKPRNFWENFDSDDEDWNDDEDYDEEGTPITSLPLGGDTSDVREPKRILPRNMSVRMPGFRGTGGFLLGNSVGIDRHGSNNRRPHVNVSSSSLRKRTSEELLRRAASGHRHGKGFVLPFTVQYLGVRRFKERMREKRMSKDERQKEKRRQTLRSSIQHSK